MNARLMAKTYVIGRLTQKKGSRACDATLLSTSCSRRVVRVALAPFRAKPSRKRSAGNSHLDTCDVASCHPNTVVALDTSIPLAEPKHFQVAVRSRIQSLVSIHAQLYIIRTFTIAKLEVILFRSRLPMTKKTITFSSQHLRHFLLNRSMFPPCTSSALHT